MRRIAVTGYKSFELGIFKQDEPAAQIIKKAIERELIRLLDEGLEWVVISGQLGAELWAAEAVFRLQDEYPELKLAVLAPFAGQEENWNEANKDYYESILAQADFTALVSKQPYTGPAQFVQKNRLLLHKTDGLLIVYDEEREGSPKYMHDLAKRYRDGNEYEIRMIDFYDLQSLAEEELGG